MKLLLGASPELLRTWLLAAPLERVLREDGSGFLLLLMAEAKGRKEKRGKKEEFLQATGERNEATGR